MRVIALTLALLASLVAPSSYRDEFHGPSSLARYSTCYRWGCAAPWNGELETYTTANVAVVRGKLDLQATHSGSRYASGMVTTAGRFAFLYGQVEARMKLPAGQGLWPALWLLAENGQSTTELDMMEVLGNAPTQLHSGVHWRDSAGHHQHKGTTYAAPDLSQGYHVYGIDWQADHITWTLDGQAYYTTTDAASIPHTALYLLANLAVGGTWPGNPDPSTRFPADFLIDWIHVHG